MQAVLELEATEREAILDLAELGDAIFVEAREGVTLRPCLVRPTGRAVLHAFQLFARIRSHRIESPIQVTDVRALAFEFG
jgi:hypothetical protein